MTTTPTARKQPADRRPSTARKHTRATKAKADAELDRGIAVSDTDGTRLQVRVRDVKGKHDAALVAATGYDFVGLLEAMSKRQGLDLMAAMFWFCRLVNGRADGVTEGERYVDVLEVYGYEEFIVADFDEPEKEADAPKA